MVRRDIKVQVQVHNVQNQVKLVKVHLELQKVKSHPRNLDIELVQEVFCHFRVLQSRDVVHSLQHIDVYAVLRSEALSVSSEKLAGSLLKPFLLHHLQEEAHKHWKHNSVEFLLEFIQRKVHKILHLCEGIKELLRLGCGFGTLTRLE